MVLSRGTKRLKLRKTLHLPDTIGGGKRVQENPPPGTMKVCRPMPESVHSSRTSGSDKAFVCIAIELRLK
jgi:hypothetical protein